LREYDDRIAAGDDGLDGSGGGVVLWIGCDGESGEDVRVGEDVHRPSSP
jgi:hypothetical protein